MPRWGGNGQPERAPSATLGKSYQSLSAIRKTLHFVYQIARRLGIGGISRGTRQKTVRVGVPFQSVFGRFLIRPEMMSLMGTRDIPRWPPNSLPVSGQRLKNRLRWIAEATSLSC